MKELMTSFVPANFNPIQAGLFESSFFQGVSQFDTPILPSYFKKN